MEILVEKRQDEVTKTSAFAILRNVVGLDLEARSYVELDLETWAIKWWRGGI